MQTLCLSCNTIQSAVGFNLSDKEIINLSKLGLSEHLCKSCYNKALSAMLESTKAELIPLNEQKEITHRAYFEAYEAWKAKAALFQAIDYNMNMIKFETAKKESAAIKKPSKSKEPLSVDLLAKKILSGLSIEQQEAIIRAFQSANRVSQQA